MERSASRPAAQLPLTFPWPAAAGATAWLLTVAAVAVSALMGGVFPSPFETTATVAAYFRVEHDAALAAAVITLVSVVPLVLFVSGVAGMLARMGAASGAARVVMVAGTAAGALAAVSAGGIWVLTRPEAGVDIATTHIIADGVFVAGGPMFAEMIGLVCLAVASGTRVGPASLPRGLNRAGFVIGAAGLLGVLGLVWPAFVLLMPVARFGGLGWLTAVALVLGRRLTAVDRERDALGADAEAVSR